ncbi:MAG: aldo/keto reductase [Erysipelotrichaceae bacterium]|nr:aldo/keto reductase [Erysipelotrichaceae bacterium]
MIYRRFEDIDLSLLGFGCMRLPLNPDKSIDTAEFQKMVDYAIGHGINYFDTAQPYHDGNSQIELGKALKKYPRNSYYIATKYPGHQIRSSYDPAEVFENQLKAMEVDYFDFYLLHNVYENSIGVYEDPKWGIIDYFIEQKHKGRIRHLGFSTHARPATIDGFLDRYGDELEFCQIQLNYLDWSLQDAKEKYEILTTRGIPVWVMEPVRGGKLASFAEGITKKLRGYRPDESTPAWAFRYLQRLDNVHMILSGMSNIEQMKDNVKTFEELKPLNEEETGYIYEVAESLKSSVPCTGCSYCMEGCPMGLEIPHFISTYNDLKVTPTVNVSMWIEFLEEGKKPWDCIGCGQCSSICPQGIAVPEVLKELSDIVSGMTSWHDISKAREEAEKRNRK